MRVKALLTYYFTITKNTIIVFFSCLTGAVLLSAILTLILATRANLTPSHNYNGVSSSTLIPFVIFMMVFSLIISQNETRFLITRSVSRKEIFVTSSIFILLLSIILSALQIIYLYFNGFINYLLLGIPFKGIEIDSQTLISSDMKNVFVFFLTSIAFMIFFGATSYLLGTLFAKWKVPTICALIILVIGIITLLSTSGFGHSITVVFNYIFTDNSSGLILTLKLLILSVITLAVTFPIMRRITAAKQTK